MTSLTRVSIVARKIIRYGTYLLILGVILRFVVLFGKDIYYQINPTEPPPPEVPFGQLSELPFPIKDKELELTYELILPDNSFPEFPIQLDVFEMPKTQTNLRVLDEAKSKAKGLGFNENGTELVESVFVFENDGEPSRLTMNIVNGIFSISYDVRSNLSLLGRLPPSFEDADQELNNSLTRANSKPDDLSGPVTHEFYKISESGFSKAISRSEADVIKINYFRKEYTEGMPSMTPSAYEANVWFYLGGTDNRNSSPIVGGEYHYYPINEQKNGTYPIKTAEEAWNELTGGNAYIANLGDNDSSVIIRKIYLGYYDAGQYTPFFQPIVVFEGDNEFVAYVPAVDSQFYGQKAESE